MKDEIQPFSHAEMVELYQTMQRSPELFGADMHRLMRTAQERDGRFHAVLDSLFNANKEINRLRDSQTVYQPVMPEAMFRDALEQTLAKALEDERAKVNAVRKLISGVAEQVAPKAMIDALRAVVGEDENDADD